MPYSAETHTSAPRGFTVARTVAVRSPAAETVAGPTVAGPRPAAVTRNDRIDEPARRANTLEDAVQSSAPYDVEPAWYVRRSDGSTTSSGPPESPLQVSAVRVPTGPAQNMVGRSTSVRHSLVQAASLISRMRPAYSVGASTSLGVCRIRPQPAIVADRALGQQAGLRRRQQVDRSAPRRVPPGAAA